MNQKQRAWNRANASRASASFSERGEAAVCDGSFIQLKLTQKPQNQIQNPEGEKPESARARMMPPGLVEIFACCRAGLLRESLSLHWATVSWLPCSEKWCSRQFKRCRGKVEIGKSENKNHFRFSNLCVLLCFPFPLSAFGISAFALCPLTSAFPISPFRMSAFRISAVHNPPASAGTAFQLSVSQVFISDTLRAGQFADAFLHPRIYKPDVRHVHCLLREVQKSGLPRRGLCPSSHCPVRYPAPHLAAAPIEGRLKKLLLGNFSLLCRVGR